MSNSLKVLLILFHFFAALSTMKIKNGKDAMIYLNRYGYMDDYDFESSLNPETQGIMNFQKFAGLQETGNFDGATMKKMNMPRCGNKERMDITLNEQMSPSQGNRWRFSHVHYRIKNFPRSGLSREAVRRSVRKAFKFWEQVADITSIEVQPSDKRQVEVDISFERDDHGDGYSFGQREIGEAVAHTFFPEVKHDLEGDIHFDNERGWTVDTKDGINFFQVCVHEIGHALGLRHSMVEDSVMHMFVKSQYDPNFKLHQDDIQGIRNLYGRKISWAGFQEHVPPQSNSIRENLLQPEYFQKPFQFKYNSLVHPFGYFQFKERGYTS